MEKKKKSGAVPAAAIVGIALLLAGGSGFGGGFGGDSGQGIIPAVSNQVVEQTQEVTEPADKETEENLQSTVIIEVKQDEYFIDGEKADISQIEELIKDKSESAAFAVEDNYASTKAWDDIMKLFAEYEIGIVEQ